MRYLRQIVDDQVCPIFSLFSWVVQGRLKALSASNHCHAAASQKKSPNELENLKLWVTFECWGYSPVRIKWPATSIFGQQNVWTSPHVRGFLWGQRIIKSIKSERKRQRIDLPIPSDPINWRIEPYPGTSLNNNHALHATSDWIQLKRAAHNDFFLNAF